MLISGEIQVEATITENEEKKVFTATLNVDVESRNWETEIDFTRDTTTWGLPNPGYHGHLGKFTRESIRWRWRPKSVDSGPNRGLRYIAPHDSETSVVYSEVTSYINRHFYLTDNVPELWETFENAQGGDGEAAYEDIREAVETHEGYPEDLTTESHYKHWHVDGFQKGTPEDPAVKLEELVWPPDGSWEQFTREISDKIRRYGLAILVRYFANEHPGTYLSGSLDFDYPGASEDRSEDC